MFTVVAQETVLYTVIYRRMNNFYKHVHDGWSNGNYYFKISAKQNSQYTQGERKSHWNNKMMPLWLTEVTEFPLDNVWI